MPLQSGSVAGYFSIRPVDDKGHKDAVAAGVKSADALAHLAIDCHPYLIEAGQILQRLMQGND